MNTTEIKLAIEAKFTDLSHLNLADYITLYADAPHNDRVTWFDGYITALELILELIA